jgi:Phenol hydroxylase, C-terminal dimerisation domain/FAD binding domain
MNTAFLDAHNLAWKIHSVEAGFASRSILSTYESERKSVAESLLNFDAKYAKLFSARLPSAGEVSEASSDTPSANKFVELFKSSCEFTSGYGTAYGPNALNWHTNHAANSRWFLQYQKGTSLRNGHLMPPAALRRVVDANVVDLQDEIPVNGSFRIYIFAGQLEKTKPALQDMATNLQESTSFYKIFERPDVSAVSHHERHNPHSLFFTLCTVFANKRPDIEIATLPPLLARYQFHVYADDIPDIRVLGSKAAAHEKMGIDLNQGAVVVARPDGFVGCVVRLVEGAGTVSALNSYFSAFSARAVGNERLQARL